MYIIPANTKKGQLILNIFRMVDLIILGSGTLVTMALLFIIPGNGTFAMLIKLLPVSICGILVMPVANYHNVISFIIDVINFYNNRRIYLWKGWCASSDENESKQ